MGGQSLVSYAPLILQMTKCLHKLTTQGDIGFCNWEWNKTASSHGRKGDPEAPAMIGFSFPSIFSRKSHCFCPFRVQLSSAQIPEAQCQGESSQRTPPISGCPKTQGVSSSPSLPTWHTSCPLSSLEPNITFPARPPIRWSIDVTTKKRWTGFWIAHVVNFRPGLSLFLES
jgi:hypothetical protein